MTNDNHIIISLIRHAIMPNSSISIKQSNWHDIIQYGKTAGLSTVFYYSIIKLSSVPEEIKIQFYNTTIAQLTRACQQNYWYKKIIEYFEMACVDYMPLKGIVIKNKYPNPEMRLMGDIDILIKEEQMPIVDRIMCEIGFTRIKGSMYEDTWKHNNVIIEFHTSLFDKSYSKLYKYGKDCWERANREVNSRKYTMTNEDFFIYIFLHLIKHLYIGGVGMRHIIDLCVLMHCDTPLNMGYIRKETEKLKLDRTLDILLQTIDYIFYGNNNNEEVNQLILFIIESGSFGTEKIKYEGQALKNEINNEMIWNKFSYAMKMLFPSFSQMQKQYPKLKKKYMIPAYWALRLIQGKGNAMQVIQIMKLINSPATKEKKKFLQTIGINEKI